MTGRKGAGGSDTTSSQASSGRGGDKSASTGDSARGNEADSGAESSDQAPGSNRQAKASSSRPGRQTNPKMIAALKGYENNMPSDAQPSLVRQVAMAYSHAGDPASAERLASRVIKASPNDALMLRLRAVSRVGQGNAEGAASDAKRLLALDPGDGLARTILGNPDAVSDASARVDRMKLNFGALSDPGGLGPGINSLYAGGAAPAPARAPEKLAAPAEPGLVEAAPGPAARTAPSPAQARALASAPASASPVAAIMRAAVEKLAMGDLASPDGALFHLSRVLMLEPENVQAHLLRARVLNLLGDQGDQKSYEAAIVETEKVLKANPKSAGALFEKGYAELKLGRVKEALSDIEPGLALEPHNGMGRLYHAMALEKSGLTVQAIEEYKKAAALEPSLRPIVDEALARMSGGSAEPEGRGLKLPARTLALVLAAAAVLSAGYAARRFFSRKAG